MMYYSCFDMYLINIFIFINFDISITIIIIIYYSEHFLLLINHLIITCILCIIISNSIQYSMQYCMWSDLADPSFNCGTQVINAEGCDKLKKCSRTLALWGAKSACLLLVCLLLVCFWFCFVFCFDFFFYFALLVGFT